MKTNEAPAPDWANWANWALILAAKEIPTAPGLAEVITQRFCETLALPAGPVFVVTTSDGHWGRGKSIGDATRVARNAGARRPALASVCVVLNDAEPYVDGNGATCARSQAFCLRVGTVGTVGNILNANPDA